MRQFLHILLLPHENNHFRAKALHPHFFLGYVATLLLPFLVFGLLLLSKPGILGITAFFDSSQIIAKTNEARTKAGLPELSTNTKLTTAAQKKAEDMVASGYWAHFAPSGKTPWDFIREAGYEFTAAGENLARDFDSIDPVISAWLASTSHAENLLSKNFTELGVGVAQGTISGKTTTVVVQMFGKPAIIPVAAVKPAPAKIETVLEGQPLTGQAQAEVKPIQKEVIDVAKLVKPTPFNYFAPSKAISLALVSFVGLLIFGDFTFVKFAKLARTGSHPIFHLAILLLIFFAIWYSNSGLIL